MESTATDLLNESDYIFLGFVSYAHGTHFNRILHDMSDVEDFIENCYETESDNFPYNKVKDLEINQGFYFEFPNGTWATITASKLF